MLKFLHWLNVKRRIAFKTATVIYKYLDSGLLQYFHEYINYYTSSANTRHDVATNKYIVVPTFIPWIHKSKTHSDESFANDGPRFWNSLPLAVRSVLHTGILRLTSLMKPILLSIPSSGCANAF